jgi:hypothetical protein
MRYAFVLLGSALLLTGCGASDPTAAEEVSAAAEQAVDTGSSRIALSGGDETATYSGEGMVDYRDRRATFTYKVESKPGEEEMRGEGEFRAIGSMAYMENSIFGAAAGDDERLKPWVAFDLSETEPSLDNLLFPFPFIDPTRLLNALQEVSGDLEELGSKEIRGVETEGFRLEVDFRRLIEEAPAAHRDELLAELENEPQKTLAVEVWIDDDGFVRRLVDRRDSVTLDFFDFGVEVDVRAPPEDQVMDDDVFWEGEESSSVGDDEEVEVETGELEGGWSEYGDTVEEDG